MNRLLITNGSFTTLVLATILSEREINFKSKNYNFLLYYFTQTTEEKNQSQLQFAQFFLQYKKAFNLLKYKKNFSFNLQSLKTELTHSNINEIYIPINSTTLKWYKLLQSLYPKAEYIFYEEGLMSYIKGIYDKQLNKLLMIHTSYYLFYNHKIRQLLPLNCTNLNRTYFLQNIKAYQDNHQIISKNYSKSKKYALVLPQYYFQNNLKKQQQLQNFYLENISILLNNGYHVLFKDHPKSQSSYYPFLAQKFKNNFTLLTELDNLPVELIGNLIDIKVIFSAYSTSLFTLPYLFNIPSCTSYKMLEHRVNTLSLYPALLGEFTKTYIKDINNQSFNYNILLYLYRKMLNFIYKIF